MVLGLKGHMPLRLKPEVITLGTIVCPQASLSNVEKRYFVITHSRFVFDKLDSNFVSVN